jgi:hypothetical protein
MTTDTATFKDRTVAVDRQMELLKGRTDSLAFWFEILVRDPSEVPDDPMFHIQEPMQSFDSAVSAAVKRLQELAPAELSTQKKAVLGWFQKQFRRIRAAQKDLKRHSESIAFSAPAIGNAKLLMEYGDEPKTSAALAELFLNGDLDRLAKDAIERMLRLELPAIVAAQECVFAALVFSVSGTIVAIRNSPEYMESEQTVAG